MSPYDAITVMRLTPPRPPRPSQTPAGPHVIICHTSPAHNLHVPYVVFMGKFLGLARVPTACVYCRRSVSPRSLSDMPLCLPLIGSPEFARVCACVCAGRSREGHDQGNRNPPVRVLFPASAVVVGDSGRPRVLALLSCLHFAPAPCLVYGPPLNMYPANTCRLRALSI